MSKHSKIAEAWAAIECAGDEVDKYWPIIENVLDKERDEDIKKYMFEADKIEFKTIADIIDSWEMAKEHWKETIMQAYVDYYKSL